MSEIQPPTNAVEQKTGHFSRETTGKLLLRFAWAIEILAASIGVALAIMFIIKAIRQQDIIAEFSGHVDFGLIDISLTAPLAGLPFLMVAIVEITKIPLVTAFFHARSRLWRIIFGLGLLLVMIITFETFMTGSEQFFHARERPINELKTQLEYVKKEISDIDHRENQDANILIDLRKEQKDSQAVKQNIIRNWEKDRDNLQDRQDKELKKLNDEMDRLYSSDSKGVIAGLETQKSELQKEFDKLEKNRERDLRNAKEMSDTNTINLNSGLKDRRKTIQSQISNKNTLLEVLNKKQEKESDKFISDNQQKREFLKTRIVNKNNEMKNIAQEEAEALERFKSERENAENTYNKKIAECPLFCGGIKDEKKEKIASIDEREGKYIASIKDRRITISSHVKSHENELKKLQSETFFDTKSASSIEEEQVSLKEEIQALEKKLNDLNVQTQRQNASNEYNDRIEKIEKAFSSNNKKLTSQLSRIQKSLSIARTKTEDSNKSALQLIDKRKDIILKEYKAKFDRRVNAKNESIKRWENTYDNRNKEIQNREKSNFGIPAHTTAIPTESTLTFCEREKTRLPSKQDSLKKDWLTSCQNILRNQISALASDLNVYRIAQLVHGKESPADVTKEELKTVVLVWFGSIGAIVAWTGTLLAFASLVVRFGWPPKGEPRSKYGAFKLFSSLRKLAIDYRRRIRRPVVEIREVEKEIPVEVVREVPVDKVSIKEVPKEIVRKELVYVPFYTNDPDLLNQNNDELNKQNNPPEDKK